MSAPIIKRCACGRTYTLSQWESLPRPHAYVAEGEEPMEIHEQRQCHCGSHMVVRLDGRGLPEGSLPDSGRFLATAAVLLSCLCLAACGGTVDSSIPAIEADSGGMSQAHEAGTGEDATPVEEAGQDAGSEAAAAPTLCCQVGQSFQPCADPVDASWTCNAPTHPPFACDDPLCVSGVQCGGALGEGVVVRCGP